MEDVGDEVVEELVVLDDSVELKELERKLRSGVGMGTPLGHAVTPNGTVFVAGDPLGNRPLCICSKPPSPHPYIFGS